MPVEGCRCLINVGVSRLDLKLMGARNNNPYIDLLDILFCYSRLLGTNASGAGFLF